MNIQSQPKAQTEKIVTVLQGEVRVTAAPEEVLSTVLGSCVAVCLWDEEASVGGMNHFLLPQSAGRGGDAVKFGANAMELLINGLLKAGARRPRLSAKLFGGAAMGNHSGRIGQSNIAFARAFLKDEGIPCVAESLGGNEARRVKFWATTGKVKLLLVPRMDEPELPPVLVKDPSTDDITLF